MSVLDGQKESLFTSLRRTVFLRNLIPSPSSPPQSPSDPSPPPRRIDPAGSNPKLAGPSTPLQKDWKFPPTPDPTPPQRQTEIDNSDSQRPGPSKLAPPALGLHRLSKKETSNSGVLGALLIEPGEFNQRNSRPLQSNRVAPSKNKRAGARSAQNQSSQTSQRLKGARARIVLSDIRRLKDGTFPLPKAKLQIERTLPYDQYKELSDFIENHAEDELRQYWDTDLHFDYTYDPPGSSKNLVIRMPQPPHDRPIAAITKEITRWYKDVEEKQEYHKGDKTTIAIANCLVVLGTTRTCLQDGSNCEPDQSFRIERDGQDKDHPYSAVLIEVSYSQRPKPLRDRAEKWIKFTDSKVRTVIGLDLNDIYKSKQSATLYVWKSRDGKPELVLESKFRDESGNAIPGVNLCLSLSDFLQDDDIRDTTRFVDPEMMISSETLVKALEKALKHLEVEKASKQNIMNRMEQTSKERSGWRGTLRSLKRINYKSMMKN